MILETERLLLRNWRDSDVNHYLVLANDVGYHCFSRPGRFLVRSAEEAQAKVRERVLLFEERKLGKFPVFLKESGEFIGTCGMEPFDLDGRSEVELGYRLCLNFWGKGYAREAAAAILSYGFGDLKLPRIMAFALAQNKASLGILDQLGFRYLREFMHGGLPHRLYEFPQRDEPDQHKASLPPSQV
jgi:ribosomal-protein-alanine N-acetyltransferase